MLALLLASTVAAAPASTGVVHRFTPGGTLLKAPPACQRRVTELTRAPPNSRLFHKLGDLPKAHEEIAVERSIGGCPAPLIVRYDVEGDGRAADVPEK